MGDRAQPYLLKPYPRPTGEAQSRLELYLTRQPPLTDIYRPRSTSDHILDLAEKLKRDPANVVAQRDVSAAAAQQVAAPPARVSLGLKPVSEPAYAPHAEGTGRGVTAAGYAEPVTPVEDTIAADTTPEPEVAPDEGNTHADVHIHLPADDEYTLGKGGVRHFTYRSPEGTGFIAVDPDGNPLTDTAGDYIPVDRAGRSLADKPTRRTRTLRFLSRGGEDLDAPEGKTPVLYDGNGAPVVDFTVPKVGGGLVISERIRGFRMLTVLIAIATLTLVIGGLVGLKVGRSAVPAQGAISAQEAQQYRLSQFPTGAAAAFGEQYLHTCLTHGDAAQVEARKAFLDSMTTAGVETGCGWTAGGAVQQPELIAFTGRVKTISGFAGGQASYLYYNVSMEPGEFLTVSVPIWVKSQSESNDMKVVGNIGFTAPVRTADPPGYEAPRRSDMALVGSIQQSLIDPFLRAWAASDGRQLALTITSDAFPEARSGLQGALENPQLGEMSAYTTKLAASGDRITYVDGDTAEVVVEVTWDVPNTSSTQVTGYRIGVRNVAGKWLVTDIGGGAVTDRAADPNGSRSSGIGGADSAGTPANSSAPSSSKAPQSTQTEQAEPSTQTGEGEPN